MHIELFRHQFKKIFRSSFFRQGWAVKILLALVALYFLAAFGLLGFFMKEILSDAFPEAEKLSPVFSEGVLFYFLADLALRFFLQDLNVLSVQHYLTVPLSKKRVVHFLLQSSAFNFFNLIPLLFIVPWAIRVMPDEYGLAATLAWTGAYLALILSNHYIAIYLKRVLAVKPIITIGFGVLVALSFIANSMEWIDLRAVSSLIYAPLAEQTYWIVLPMGLMVLTYLVNYRFLLQMTHLDRWQSKAKQASSLRFSFLEERGFIGTMIANELKLITRNKRTKTVVFLGIFMSLYGLIFYTQEVYAESYSWLLFVGIFMTGIFMINYGQFLVSWESSYFDGILTRAYSMEEFYRSKYYLMVFSVVVMYVITLPYLYFGIHAFYINTAAALYNLGVNSAVLLFASTYNKKPIDLSRGSAFNYQGTGAAQFVIVIPLIVVPILVFQGFNLLEVPEYGLAFLGLMGLVGIFTSSYFIKQTVLNFKEKKYTNAAGYRQRD